MQFDLVALAYVSQRVNLAYAILMSLVFHVILNIALRCLVLSVLHGLFFNSAALSSPVRNLYVLALPCATHNCLTITFLPCTALPGLVQPCMLGLASDGVCKACTDHKMKVGKFMF